MDRRQLLASLGTLLLTAAVAACATPTLGEIVDDASITMWVKTALLNDPEVGVLPIDVEVTGGVVRLEGRVRSPEQEQKAVALTRALDGVVDVRSALRIEP